MVLALGFYFGDFKNYVDDDDDDDDECVYKTVSCCMFCILCVYVVCKLICTTYQELAHLKVKIHSCLSHCCLGLCNLWVYTFNSIQVDAFQASFQALLENFIVLDCLQL